MNHAFYEEFLGQLYTAVQRGRPFTAPHRVTLVRMAMLLVQDVDDSVALPAVRVILEMNRVNSTFSCLRGNHDPDARGIRSILVGQGATTMWLSQIPA